MFDIERVSKVGGSVLVDVDCCSGGRLGCGLDEGIDCGGGWALWIAICLW